MIYKAVLGLLFLFCTPAYADAITVEELAKSCRSSDKKAQSFCYGFVISAANAAQFYRNLVDINDDFIDICFPDTIHNRDIIKLFTDWAKKNQQASQSPAFIGVSTSFSTRYSCSDKGDSVESESRK